MTEGPVDLRSMPNGQSTDGLPWVSSEAGLRSVETGVISRRTVSPWPPTPDVTTLLAWGFLFAGVKQLPA